jgi:hypothetical protein
MAGVFPMAGALEPAGEGLPGAGSGLAGISTESDESAHPETPAEQITQRTFSNANENLFTASNSYYIQVSVFKIRQLPGHPAWPSIDGTCLC